MYQSETSKFRYLFLDYCKGNGIDIGFGGDPILPTAITIDLPIPYAETGESSQNLRGDGRNLYWFNDNTQINQVRSEGDLPERRLAEPHSGGVDQ